MRLSLHQTELKVFIRCVNSLAKLGNEIYFNWTIDGLYLKTVNQSRSAYASVVFKPCFFEKCSTCPSEGVTKFKIASRSCCNIFKPSVSLERAVHKCRIILNDDRTLLIVQFFCKYGIVKTFNMSIMDCEHLEALYSLEESANHLALSTRILIEVLNNFKQSSEEITVILKEGECTFQNYILQGDPTSILTQLPLSADEFDSYLVGLPSELTFSQKELRALLNFCDLVSPVLRIYCDRPGKPMIFACTHETRLCARFVLATLPSDAYAVSASQRSQPVQRHAIFSKTPVQVRRVALNPATQSQRPSRPVFPTFDGDTTANEVTLLTNVARESTESPTVGATETAVINQSRMVLSNVRNPKLMNTQPVTTILSPIPPPRPYNVPRISQPVRSTEVSKASADINPPFKKARSELFSFIEHSEDADSMTVEDMDLELQQLTRPFCLPNPNFSNYTTATPGRTVLVADSDEEN
ncbi:Cell cycle checkpoint control protein RAD9A [Fasciolopsis buskii]|uniref:Cell cycle checkpoint control protein RAD9A n=1 Tax=Fasciolopsis buskii TaxID=27845 RepID=A0A8E0RX07_9TREM|nr:Cell cycle checkpoint control protein RAD9A [Fasciolopsis buski]